MRAIRTIAIVATLAFISTIASAQRDVSNVEIKVTKVSSNIYMLEGSGGNIALSVGDDGVFMVDDQFVELSPKIHAAIKSITDKPVRFLVNTHYHFDHTSGNVVWGKETTILSADNLRKRLEAGSSVKGNVTPPAPKSALPVITFDSSITVHMNGEDIRVQHTPHGHTDGDSIVIFPKSNVVHMGDQVVTYGLPFVDTDGGGNLMGMIENVEKTMASLPDDVKIIPGHGPVLVKADVKQFTEMLRDCIALVSAGVKKGKTLDQLKSEHVLAKYEDKGKGFVKTDEYIEMIYNDLKKTK